MRSLLPLTMMAWMATLSARNCTPPTESGPQPQTSYEATPLQPDHVNPQAPSPTGWTGVDGGSVFFRRHFDGGAGVWVGSDGRAYRILETPPVDPCLPAVLQDAGAQLKLYTVTDVALNSNVCAGKGYRTRNPDECAPPTSHFYEGKAVIIPGCWMPDGGFNDGGGDTPCFTASCTTGAVGVCAHWGYLPNQEWDGGPPLARLFQACVRAARADYNGDGESFTCQGTYVDFVDGHGIQTQDTFDGGLPPMLFEAAWNEHGALPFGVTPSGESCLRPRYTPAPLSRIRGAPGAWMKASYDCQQPGDAGTPLKNYFDAGVPFLLLTQTWKNDYCVTDTGPGGGLRTHCPACNGEPLGPRTCHGGSCASSPQP
ncbi:ADYC domain-containing protein [Myxococcus hansupus]|nr:ADYC domain-containing protein [Myxococcus hansupus]